jgi:phosphatidate cytidylyltransferase
MLWQRMVTALILIPLVIGALFYLAPVYLAALIVVVAAIGGWEWAKLANLPAIHAQSAFALGFGLLTALLLQWGGAIAAPQQLLVTLEPLWLLAAFWWLLAIVGVLIFPRGRRIWRWKSVLALAGVMTIIPFAASIVALADLSAASDPHIGPKVLLAVMVVVWSTDSGAYFVGRAWGRHKLSPAVSPGKTWEGLIGGLLAAFIAAALAAQILPLEAAAKWPFIIGAVIAAVISVFGDLSESMFKRMAGVKDSGRILPGHGGMLDRVDSLCAALPVFALSYLWLGGY